MCSMQTEPSRGFPLHFYFRTLSLHLSFNCDFPFSCSITAGSDGAKIAWRGESYTKVSVSTARVFESWGGSESRADGEGFNPISKE